MSTAEQDPRKIDRFMGLIKDPAKLHITFRIYLKEIPEPIFEALCQFLTRHRANGLFLKGDSRTLEQLIGWVWQNSFRGEKVASALDEVSDALIVAAVARRGGNPFGILWESLNANLKRELRQKRTKAEDHPNFEPEMKVSATARRDGWHHKKPGHS